MVAWQIAGFGGVIPRLDVRVIGDNMAAEAFNVDLTGGALVSLPQPQFLHDLSGVSGPVEKAYRFTGGTTWQPLPSRYSSAVRSPLANDDQHRLYWTNPGDLAPHFNTQDRVTNGQPAYDLGIPQPTSALHIDSVDPVTPPSGGTNPPDIERSYVYTYVNSFGEESSPSPPSNIVAGQDLSNWHISGIPTTAPGNPGGYNYPAVVSMHLYRVVTSASSGAQYYYVTTFNFPCGSTYTDSAPDTQVVMNGVLETVGWGNPPNYLDGLVALAGGMLVGFTGNTVHFTEPNRPHTWPSIYDQSVHYDIVTMVAWQNYLMVLTAGFPTAGSGNTPSNFIMVQTQVAEPCIARGSALVDTSGVYYASQNGLVLFTGYMFQNQTQLLVEKNEWLNYYHAASIICARHRMQYVAVNGTNQGFLIDYSEPQRLGFEDLSTMQNVVCVWNDEHTGDTLMMANKQVYVWDSNTAGAQIYRWKSKAFGTPKPISLGAVQIDIDETITTATGGSVPLDNGAVTLPAGVNAQFKYYAGPQLQLIMTRNLSQPQEIFRLPKGFKTFYHQVEVISRVPIFKIQLGETLNDLKTV